MLPSAPKDVGRLSEVFTSALASVDDGAVNSLRLPKVKHSVVILVDGLGFENLRNASSYSRFLNSVPSTSIRCEFPSTTATSITGFATGKRSGEHGMLGYGVYDRAKKQYLNLLTGWESAEAALGFKRAQTVSELASGVSVYSIGPSAYESSGFTQLTMPSAKYLAAQSIGARFEAVGKLVKTYQRSLSYLYIPELDQLAHRFGVDSRQWLEALEDLDREISNFIAKVAKNVGVIITADHGVIDVPQSSQVYLDEFEWYRDLVEHTAGDPRCNFVYLKPNVDSVSARSFLEAEFAGVAYVCDSAELVNCDWLSPIEKALELLVPDFYVIWKEPLVGYDRRFAKESHLRMIGQHGGISDAETRVPLIRLGGY